MAIEFSCPRCGKFLTTTDARALALAKCPSCNELITVPASTEHAEATPVSSAQAPELAATAMWSSALTPGPPVAGAPSVGPPSAGPHDSGSPSQFASGTVLPDASPPTTPALEARPTGVGFAPPEPAAALSTERRIAPGFGPSQFQACPRCGQPVVFGAAYCGACGVALIPAGYPLQYAGFFRRTSAALLDLTFVFLAWTLLALVFGFTAQTWLLVWFFYNAALEGSREQATIGKRLFGLVVCGVDGRRLTFPRAAIRTIAKLASFAICGMGFVMPLLTPRKQALHDLMTDAVVVLS